MSSLTEIQSDFKTGLLIWWQHQWRFFIFGVLPTTLLGMAMGKLGEMNNIAPEAVGIVVFMVNFILGIIASSLVYAYLIKKGFGRFRLAMVEKEDLGEE